jgi:deoxyribose-phosphate aldolase
MRPVFTAVDLGRVAAGGEVAVPPDALVTPLAREEAARRGITLRTAAPGPVAAPAAPAPAPAESSAAAPPPASAQHLDDLVRAITEEVLRCLEIGAPAPLAAGEDGAGRPAAAAGRISPAPASSAVETALASLAGLIDHTLLRPEASRDDIVRLCEEAVRLGFAAVCVNPWYVPLAAEHTRGSAVKVCTVVGFPLGATLPRVKLFEAAEAIKLGAQEIDMVQNVGALKSGQDDLVEADIRGVVQAAHRGGAVCKVILETALLTPEEKVRAALAARRAGADFLKTSTGFSSAGATAEDVALLRAAVGPGMGIKASGGIRTLAELRQMVAAGATRIGASAGVRILREAGEPAASPEPPQPAVFPDPPG